MGKFFQSVRIFFAEGNSWLRDYEVEVIKWFVENLPLDDKVLASRQFAHYDLIQRSPNGKILMFFRCGDDKRLSFDQKWHLSPHDKEHKTRFEIQLSNQEKVAGFIFVTFGRISSIECKLRPQKYSDRKQKISELGAELVSIYGEGDKSDPPLG